jgi:uncharacterized protein YggE
MRVTALRYLLPCCVLVCACMHPRAIVLSPTAPQGVSVIGIGKASAAPDLARANLGVEVRTASPEQSAAEAATRMAAVLQALKTLGIADKDLHTHSYSVNFEADPQPTQPNAAATVSTPHGQYRVANLVEVKIHDLNSVGRVLKTASDAGANNVWGVSFEIEDETALVAQARALAVDDAKRSAAALATLTGVKLGAVISVLENESSGGYSAGPVTSMRASSQGDVPIESGEISVSFSVQIVYATAD